MAIILAALAPAVGLVGNGKIWGNVDLELATKNTLNFLTFCGRVEVPVTSNSKPSSATISWSKSQIAKGSM
jgi:inosine-uridine nucleoside N-ribohydrolase